MSEIDQPVGDAEPTYNMKAVVAQTGLNPATIRAWERRYGLPEPGRTEGGHREFTQRDINTLKWLVARQDDGISISHAVDLWRAYTDKGEDPLQAADTGLEVPLRTPAPPLEGGQIDQLRQAWISACRVYDRETAEHILTQAFARYNPEMVCIDLLQRGLAEIGDAWYDRQLSVQQEHFATSLSVRQMELLIAAAPPPTVNKRILVMAAPGELHTFSSLLMTYLLRRRGLDVIYLGADVPAAELEATITRVKPSLLIGSAQLLRSAANLKDIARVLEPYGVPMAFGGLVFNQLPPLRRLIPGHYLGETIEEAVQKAIELTRQPVGVTPIVSQEHYAKALNSFREHREIIESNVWLRFVDGDKPTDNLQGVNDVFSSTVEAALKLEDVRLLPAGIDSLENLLISHRLPRHLIQDYVAAYHEGARIHLNASAQVIVDWLSELKANISES